MGICDSKPDEPIVSPRSAGAKAEVPKTLSINIVQPTPAHTIEIPETATVSATHCSTALYSTTVNLCALQVAQLRTLAAAKHGIEPPHDQLVWLLLRAANGSGLRRRVDPSLLTKTALYEVHIQGAALCVAEVFSSHRAGRRDRAGGSRGCPKTK